MNSIFLDFPCMEVSDTVLLFAILDTLVSKRSRVVYGLQCVVF